jgi:hypothetical protein
VSYEVPDEEGEGFGSPALLGLTLYLFTVLRPTCLASRFPPEVVRTLDFGVSPPSKCGGIQGQQPYDRIIPTRWCTEGDVLSDKALVKSPGVELTILKNSADGGRTPLPIQDKQTQLGLRLLLMGESQGREQGRQYSIDMSWGQGISPICVERRPYQGITELDSRGSRSNNSHLEDTTRFNILVVRVASGCELQGHK